MLDKFRGIPVLYSKQTIDGIAFITYSQFDMGNKYRVYAKNKEGLGFPVAFNTLSEAYNYFDNIK